MCSGPRPSGSAGQCFFMGQKYPGPEFVKGMSIATASKDRLRDAVRRSLPAIPNYSLMNILQLRAILVQRGVTHV
jgi:hypothetical protein